MKNIIKFMLLVGVIAIGTMALPKLGSADDVTVTGVAAGTGTAQVSQQSRPTDSSCATGAGSANSAVQIIREPNAMTIVGVGSGAAGVDTRHVQGSTTGSGMVMLRIGWGGGSREREDREREDRDNDSSRGVGRSHDHRDRDDDSSRSVASSRDSRDSNRGRGVASPPGAPELPGDVMFGSGFLVLGFGLLLYRRRVQVW